MDTAPQVIPLQELGEGTYGKVDLVIYDGELLVRKQFKGSYDLTEAYALTMLQGAGGTPLIKGVIQKPLTVFMSYCGTLTLEHFLEGNPSSDEVMQVLAQLCVRVGELHAMTLVHLDLKENNVMLQYTDEGGLEVNIIDMGLAALPGQCIPFQEVDLDRVPWMCP